LPTPPTGVGLQFDLPQVMVPPGQEVQACWYLKLPSDDDFFFDHVQSAVSEGGRHLYLFKSEYFDVADDFRTDCFEPVDTNQWSVVLNSQNRNLDWTLPDGVAFHLRHRTQIMVQAHFYNTGTQPVPGRATINLWRRDDATVRHWANVIVAVQNNISIPPEGSFTTKLHCTLPVDTAETATANRIHPTHILALAGDFHRAGRDFQVENFQLSSTNGCPPNCPGTEGPPIYYDMSDGMNPLWKPFPDDAATLPNQAGFSFTCAYQNQTNQTVSFGPHVLTEEHCTLFIYFYPAPMDGMNLGCTEITGAW
jgi:hypothetical protein